MQCRILIRSSVLPQLDQSDQELRRRVFRRAQAIEVSALQLALLRNIQADGCHRDARPEHDLGGNAVAIDVVFRSRREESAAHEHNALDLRLDARLSLERKRNIGQRADGYNGQLFARVHQGIDNELSSSPLRGGRELIGRRQYFVLSRPVVPYGIKQRLRRARRKGNIAPSEQAELLPGKPRSAFDVIDDCGNGANIQLGGLERQSKRQRVINIIADIGIENDRNWLLLCGGEGNEEHRRQQRGASHVRHRTPRPSVFFA